MERMQQTPHWKARPQIRSCMRAAPRSMQQPPRTAGRMLRSWQHAWAPATPAHTRRLLQPLTSRPVYIPAPAARFSCTPAGHQPATHHMPRLGACCKPRCPHSLWAAPGYCLSRLQLPDRLVDTGARSCKSPLRCLRSSFCAWAQCLGLMHVHLTGGCNGCSGTRW